MLNTLYQIARDLEAQGVLSCARDNRLTRINAPAFLWIGLNTKKEDRETSEDEPSEPVEETTTPVEIEPTVTVESNTGRLYKFQINNQNSWPAINATFKAPAPPKEGKRTPEDESYRALLDFVESLDKKELEKQAAKIISDLETRAKRAKDYLPEKATLAQSAASTAKALESAELKAKLPTLIVAAILSYVKKIEKPKEGKKFLSQVFEFGTKKGTNLPILIGEENQYNGITGGSLVEEALTHEKKEEGDEEPGLFGTCTQRPILSGYPLMASSYYPVSRAEDFPATHGYFGGGYAPIADSAMQKIRAALDYLTHPSKEKILHYKLNLGDTPILLLACPKGAGAEDRAKEILEGLCQSPFQKKDEDDGLEAEMALEEAGAATFSPEESTEPTLEITIVAIRETLRSNLQVDLQQTRNVQEWKRILTEWKKNQVLPNGWKATHGPSLKHALCLLQSERGLSQEFKMVGKKLQTQANKQKPKAKGFDIRTFLKPTENVSLASWMMLQKNLLRLLGDRAIPTLSERRISSPTTKESTAVFDLIRTMGLLILTSNQIQKHMSEKPTNEHPAFLLGLCLQELNNLQQAYRNEREVARGQSPTGAPPNMRGTKLVALAVRPNFAATLAQIGKNATPYLEHARAMTSKKMAMPEEKRTWNKHERRLQGAANSLRDLMTKIAQTTNNFSQVPKTMVEIQQHTALVYIGLDTRKPSKPESENTTKN